MKMDRRGAFNIPELAPIKRKHQPRGKGGRFAGPVEEDVRKPAFDRRIAEMGYENNKGGRKAAAAPWLGEDLGKVMDKLCDDADEIQRLWTIWQGMSQAMRTYRLRILDKKPGPKGAAFAMIHEKLEVSADTPAADPRTEEEKDEGARESYRRWMDRLGRMRVGRALLMQAESGMHRELWTGRAPTGVGSDTLEALRALAKIIDMEGKR